MQAVEYVENGEVVGDNFDEYVEYMFGDVDLLGIRNTGEEGPGEDNRVAIFKSPDSDETIYRPFRSVEVSND